MEKPVYEVAVPNTREITEAQRVIITQETPPEVIKQREGPGGKMLSYVEHSWVTEQLNLAFNWAWSWEIREWRLIPESEPFEVFVLGRLIVHTAHGDLVKTQFGSAEVKRRKKDGQPLSIGDDLKAASSDALKKCASLLGLALDVYGGNGPNAKTENGKVPRKRGSKKQPNSVLTDAVEVRAWLTARVEQIDTSHLGADAYEKHLGALMALLKKIKLDPKAVITAAWGEKPSVEQIIAMQNLAARTNAKEEIQHLL